jgi:hypothetical protein
MRNYHGCAEPISLDAPVVGTQGPGENVASPAVESGDKVRLNILKVNFEELYRRHLCRHSQFGINVIHLAAVFGSYWGLFGLALAVVGSPWPLLAIPVLYFLLLVFNVPGRVFLASVLFVAGFFGMFLWLPPLPVWFCLALIVLSHVIQNWSHKIYSKETDMSEFNKRYKKGPVLFVLLSLYELPILLNYLLFGREDWVR